MIKKFLLGIILSFTLFSLASLPSFAQEERQLTTTQDQTYQLYDTPQDTTTNDYTSDYNYDNLTPDEQAAVNSLATLFGGAFIVVMIFAMIFGLVMYVYTSIALMKLAKRLDMKDAWFAWIPIVNFVLLAKMAQISPWTVLLILVPGVNAIYMIVLLVLAYMKACEKLGVEKMLSLLMLVPLANYVFMGYMAWGKFETKQAVPVQPETPVAA